MWWSARCAATPSRSARPPCAPTPTSPRRWAEGSSAASREDGHCQAPTRPRRAGPGAGAGSRRASTLLDRRCFNFRARQALLLGQAAALAQCARGGVSASKQYKAPKLAPASQKTLMSHLKTAKYPLRKHTKNSYQRNSHSILSRDSGQQLWGKLAIWLLYPSPPGSNFDCNYSVQSKQLSGSGRAHWA